MHRRADVSDCGSATVTDPTSSTAVRHTRVLLWGTTNVADSRKKSPPLATVNGVVVVTMPTWSVMRRLNRAVSAESTQ